MECILCKSNNVIVADSINRNEIIRLWLEYDVNVFDEIKTSLVHKYKCNNCGLLFYDPLNAGGDKFYSRLGEFDWYYLHPGKTEYDFVQTYINEGDNVLDVGSGRGVLYTKIEKRVNYTGLELSAKAVELAKEAKINVINEDLLLHAEKNNGKYDIVCLFQVLEHLTELDKFIIAIKKCLKPNGLLCIAVPNNDGFVKYAINNAFNMPPHHTLLWNRKSLEYLGAQFGFKPVSFHLEELQDVHKEWYLSTLLSKKISELARLKRKTLNFGFIYTKLKGVVERLKVNRFTGRLIRKVVFSKKAVWA